MAEKKPMSEARAKSQLENSRKPRVTLPAEVRSAAIARKANALDTLTGIGLDHITNLIAMGPGAIKYDEKGNAREECVEQFKRFSWACDYIGDRCGLSKRNETAIEADTLPEIVVKFANHPRPADS